MKTAAEKQRWSEQRFTKAWTFSGTQKTVSFLPHKTMFRRKFFQKQMFSTPHTYCTCKMSIIRGFVICEYNIKGWLACVLQVKDSEFYITPWIPLAPINPSSPNTVCTLKSAHKSGSKSATSHTYVNSDNESYCTTGNKKPGFADTLTCNIS